MTTSNKPGGTLRSSYETAFAQLDNFPALESGWRELLHRLTEVSNDSEGTFLSLWADHVLTVLVEIGRQQVSADSGNLPDKARQWIARMNRYIDRNWETGNNDSFSVQVAKQLKDRLEMSLLNNDTNKQGYYLILNAIHFIQEHFDYYLAQIENDGIMDGALSLLLTDLRNYGNITQAFNCRFATWHELYLRDILHAVPQGTVQDNTYIVITPVESTGGFTLSAGQPFPAGQNALGEDLTYRNMRQEYISPIQCAEVNAIYLLRAGGQGMGLYKQPIPFGDTSSIETLFAKTGSTPLAIGWTMESSMLVLDEGERHVTVSFRITADTPVMNIPSNSGFSLQISSAEGWTEQTYVCGVDTTDSSRYLSFNFRIAPDDAAPVPCNVEVHGWTTEQPVLRILTDGSACPYDWATHLNFDAVKIQTQVTGIRFFTLYNELGEVDTSQPFSPFGIQAGRGAWFLFGNEEMGLKPLNEVRLAGQWQKVPETEEEFNKIYKEYTTNGHRIGTDSFRLTTEWQQDGKWHSCPNGKQYLFVPDNQEDRSLAHAEVVFDFTPQTQYNLISANAPYEYSRDRDGFFRATLQAPSIGFGSDAYRKLFANVMIHNSHCKKKERKPLPEEPLVPLLSDVELSYIAVEETKLAKIKDSSFRLSRVTALPEQDTLATDAGTTQPFLPVAPSDYMLYFAFSRAKGEQRVRMYIDMALPREKIPFYNPQPDKDVTLTWQYRDGTGWKDLGTAAILTEEVNGLTQSGFIEIKLPEKISGRQIDRQGRIWLRAAVKGDVSSCLAIRSIRMNCIRLVAQNGDGFPLPAGTIQDLPEADDRIESIIQPLPGFGGRHAETETESAVRQTSRIGNRHRALTIKDYEQLVLEHFPEVDKVQCIPVPQDKGASEICLVVFSRAEDSRYYLSPSWKLMEIQRLISRYAPPFVPLRVMNPVYETIEVHCKAVLWDSVQEQGKAIRQLVVLAQNYIEPWYRKGTIPELQQHFSYKELHARMVNHEDLMKLVVLEVDGKSLPRVDIDTKDLNFGGSHPWSVLLPKIQIELLSPHDGINTAEIGGNFIIG